MKNISIKDKVLKKLRIPLSILITLERKEAHEKDRQKKIKKEKRA